MPSRGHFVLHSRAVPPLGAGDYVLEGDASIPGMESTARFEPYRGHLRVTSPRFRLPPDQILSTFPPANSEGGYESRLPQIVLRRRTLPWERIVDADRKVPWLALVVIAEGEGQLSGERPVAECVTPGVTLTGPNDVATGIHLSVPESVVKKVFPTKQDLPLLAHVREVDIADTELAMGDDDGFLAVVLGNRLPQFDRQGCKPVRYMACLINLEGQLDALPPPSQPFENFLADAFVFDAVALAQQHRYHTDIAAMGKVMAQPGAVRSDTRATAAGSVSAGAAGVTAAHATGAAATARMSDWTVATANVASVAVSAAPENAHIAVRDAMKVGFRLPIEALTVEKVYRFPVLSHWSFTCTGAGSFETFMQGLDVGLLGTMPSDPTAKPAPECRPPVGGDAPPPPPPSRAEPELAETGHVGLPHQTRRGDSVRAWYRGPLTPHVTERAAPEPDGRLPLAHTGDQLRRVVPDGREDVSHAAAFEIGRLLALSHPSIVSALMRWRREQFGAERGRRMAGAAAADSPLFREAIEHGGLAGQLGQLAGRSFVLAAAESPATVLAPARPVADPGRPLRYLGSDADLDRVLARGFGIPLESVRALRVTSDAGVLADVQVPLPDAADSFRFDASHLHAALAQNVERIAADALRLSGAATDGTHSLRSAQPDTRTEQPPDALDRLLQEAARRKAEEVDR